MKLWVVSFIALLLFAIPASAGYDPIEVTGTSSYSGDAGDGYVYSYIWIEDIDLNTVSAISLDSTTYIFNATFSDVGALSCNVNTSFYDKATGNTNYYSDTWYHLSIYAPYFWIGTYADTTGPVGGGANFIHYMPDTLAYAPSEFTFSSDAAVDLKLYTVNYQETEDFSYTGVILDIIEKVPIVGEYIASALKVTGLILSAFFTYATFIIENWPILLMTFETFVLMRAMVIMQGRGKQSKKISKALTSIISDNKSMLEFMINTFTKIIELTFSAIKAIGAWVPFT